MKNIALEWGVEVQAANLRDISFDVGMQRAMAKKAEAERLREAKIIHAESEVQTAAKAYLHFSLYCGANSCFSWRKQQKFSKSLLTHCDYEN